MRFGTVVLGIALIVSGALLFGFRAELQSLLAPRPLEPVGISGLGEELPREEQSQETKEKPSFPQGELEQEVITPPPLRAQEQAAEAALTEEGVLAWTNSQRARFGLPPLQASGKLNQAASLKLQDMFARQYFAHNAPDGTMGAGDLAEQVGYEFLLVGENLALGSYEDDKALVQAWMDSPGHRENILKERFTEIGVALGKGQYEGEGTWLAVQMFGFPRSACPSPDEALKLQIDENRGKIRVLEQALREEKEELESATPKFGPAYNREVEEYNEQVERYNALVEETKEMVNRYNGQAAEFNACAR